jgi:hypothetical protein
MDSLRAQLKISLATLGAVLLAGCSELSGESPVRAPGERARPASPHARRVVDSVRSLEEDLRRFRAGISEPPARLTGGAHSRESLVRRFVEALSRSDSAALARMALTRAEFAYLIYPSSPFSRPPYRQSPEITWLLLRAEHDKGLARVLGRMGGQSLDYRGHRCDPTPLLEGDNRLWRGCRVRVGSGTRRPQERWLFGVIVERDGRFKFASYKSEF